jgi:hypothetical protein
MALSTTEAENPALTEATNEITWVQSLLAELGIADDTPTHLSCDNQSALMLVKNPVLHARIKHMQ